MPGKQSGCADPGKQENDANGKFGGFPFGEKPVEFPMGFPAFSCFFTIWHQVLHQLGVLQWMFW